MKNIGAVFFAKAGSNSDAILVLGMIGVLLVLFMPIPPRLLDFLLLVNLSLAFLLLLMTFYVEKPVEFSTFPSLLLMATLFRLSLNVASTRLILAEGDAGRVIQAIGAFVVEGNYIIGVIVFLILVVVQYIVVTNGAQRVAEVAARFTLDSMPGQQMSIDADLNMGFIDQTEAQRRRKNIEKEANFYGAMDGASKFVKGDAIAGIIILLINIFAGLAVGVFQHGLTWLEATQKYTLLTVGDGIVTQVPALVISVGTGIIVTRSGTDSRLSSEVLAQLSAVPKAILLVGVGILFLGLLPGMPLFPAVLLFLILGGCYLLLGKRKKARVLEPVESGKVDSDDELKELLQVRPIEVRLGGGLSTFINPDDPGLKERITAFRKILTSELGIILPGVSFSFEKKLSPHKYDISMYGVTLQAAEVLGDKVLAIHSSGSKGGMEGVETKDPTYGLPALWIDTEQKGTARKLGYTLVDPLTVFLTHVTETVRRNCSSLITRRETELIIGRVRDKDSGLLDELVPSVLSLSEVQKVLQALIKERVSIKNIELILEVLVDAGRSIKDPLQLTELIRVRMGASICQTLVGATGELSVITLDPALEQRFASSLHSRGDSPRVIVEPKLMETIISKLASQMEAAMKGNVNPVLLCAPELRRHLRTVTERVLPHLTVLSMAEIPPTTKIRSLGIVKI